MTGSHLLVLRLFVLALLVLAPLQGLAQGRLRVAGFNVDATPPLGSPVAYAAAPAVRSPC